MSDPIGYEFGGEDYPTFGPGECIVIEEGSMASREAAQAASVGNGTQTGFASGATRSTSDGKIDFEGHINPEVLAIFGDYMNRHRVQRDGKVRASDNWQQGIPVYRYMKSLVRHVFELWRMWRGREVVNVDNGRPFTFRDVLCAILFNTMGMIYEIDRKASTLLDANVLVPHDREWLETEGEAVPTKPPTSKELVDAGKTVGNQRCDASPTLRGTWVCPQDGGVCVSCTPKDFDTCCQLKDLAEAARRKGTR